MKRLMFNLPFLAVFFAAAAWPDRAWLAGLAFASALLLVALSVVLLLGLGSVSETDRRAALERSWPGGKGRVWSLCLAVLLGVGMAATGHPILAGFYGLCVFLVHAVWSSLPETKPNE